MTETPAPIEGLTVWAPTYVGARRCKVTIVGLDDKGQAWGTYKVGRHFQRYVFTTAQTETLRQLRSAR